MRCVEDGDHEDGTEVVDDSDGDEQHLQAERNASADQGDDTDGEGDIGCGGDCPSSVEFAASSFCGDEGDIDEGGDCHSERGGEEGQDGLVASREFADEQFAFDFHADQKEEDRHETVVDEVLQRFLQADGADAQIDGQVQKVFVGFGVGRVCDQESQNAGGEQHDTAGGFFLHDLAERLCEQVEPRRIFFHAVCYKADGRAASTFLLTLVCACETRSGDFVEGAFYFGGLSMAMTLRHGREKNRGEHRRQMSDKQKGVLLAVVGVLLLVPTSLLIRLMPSFSVEALMFWRALPQALGLGIFAIVVLGARFSRSGLLWGMGLIYALETCSFLISIKNTYVANTLLLVSMSPLLAAMGGWLLWRQRLPMATWGAIGVCFLGLLIFASEGIGSGQWFGDAMGFLSAMAISAFFLCGQKIRSENAILAIAIGASFVMLVSFSEAISFGYPPSGEVLPLLMTLAIQPFGMAFLAVSARYIPAAEVALILLLEPFLAPIVVWGVVGEVPPGATLLGGGG